VKEIQRLGLKILWKICRLTYGLVRKPSILHQYLTIFEAGEFGLTLRARNGSDDSLKQTLRSRSLEQKREIYYNVVVALRFFSLIFFYL
jgi:hypothetical protein